MTPLSRVRAALCLPVVGILLVALAPPGASARQQGASLHASPGKYVGGQAVTFQGNIGLRGTRRIHLQTHMNRPGDQWTNLDGNFSTTTKADGSFSFTNPAPAMFGIRMRVVSGRVATPPVKFQAASQDLVLAATGTPRVGRPFTIEVDTTPDHLFRRPDLDHLPAFPGRTLTLQKRVGSDWKTLDTTTVGGNGNGSFEQTVDEPGTVVYRVRQEDWTKGGNKVGWFPSFPTPVEVGGGSGRTRATDQSDASTARVTARHGRVSALPGGTSAHRTAGQTNRWAPAVYDFAWEFGESLTSNAYRGTDRKGAWGDSSTGYGRVSKHNGGLMIDSQREIPMDRYPETSRGDRGTTSATLGGNALTYGRWEAKMRLKRYEGKAEDFHAVIELVPERAEDYRCGAQNITVADVAVNARTLRIGAKSRSGRQWGKTMRYGLSQSSAQAFAVEVSKSHISWFLNGTAIGTVRSRAASSDVPMTLRLSLVGNGNNEMNKTQFISDWQRGYTLSRSALTKNGSRLKGSRFNAGC